MGTRGTVTALRRSRFWRTVAILGGFAAIASVGITACHNEPVAPSEQIATLGKHPAGALGPLTHTNVGEYHNQFLDFAFPRVSAAVAAGADRRALCKVLTKAMRDFVGAKKIEVNPLSIVEEFDGTRCHAAIAKNGKQKPRFSLGTDDTPSPVLDQILEEMAYAAADGRSPGEVAAFYDAKISYARAVLSVEEADVVEASASVGVSSTYYWDSNYQSQAQQLGDNETAYSRSGAERPRLPRGPGAGPRGALAPPDVPLSDGWLTRIKESSWYSNTRKVVVSDLSGAFRGAIQSWRSGPRGIVTNALVQGGISSGGALIDLALPKPQ